MNRRDFLHPRQLARTALDVLDVVQEIKSLGAELPAGQDMTLLRFSRQAMAATFEILLPWGTDEAVEAAGEVLDEIDRLEDQMTVYRDHSEISQINRRAADETLRVESRLFELLQRADRLSQETEGAFDITTGALSKAWGFFRRCGRIPSGAERAEVLRRVGMRHVVLDAENRTIRYLQKGLEINLGAIGKGYALDRAATILRDGYKIRHALLHGGRSSIYALGSEPGSTKGWPVGVRHPWDPERRLAIVRLRDRGLGTSAATFQHLEYNGRKLGHIIDPRTGWPAEGLASATAIAPTAAAADALATAFFILGIEKTRTYCAAHPDVAAILLPQEGQIVPIILGLTAEEIQLCPGNGQSLRQK